MTGTRDETTEHSTVASRTQELEEQTALSHRESEYIAWKEAGYTHQEIADKMSVAKGTIDSYAHRVKTKHERASQTVTQLDDHLDSTPADDTNAPLLLEPNLDTFEEGDQVCLVETTSRTPYIRTDLLGEFKGKNDDSNAVLIETHNGEQVGIQDPTLIEASDGPKQH
jgi:DNA-binding CsgD family transcriptional regulator